MTLQIESVHFEAGKELRDLVANRCSVFEKINDRITKCTVILNEENNDIKERFSVTIRLDVPQADFCATGRATNFGKALDTAVSGIKSQMLKYKGKVKKAHTV